MVLDFGTSKVCANLVSMDNGEIVASSTRKYRVFYSAKGCSELDPQELWDCAQDCVEALVGHIRRNALCAVTFSYFGDCLIPVDGQGRPLMNCVLCSDQRGANEAGQIERMLGAGHFIELTGGECCSFATCTKMKWLHDCEPSLYRKTAGLWNNQQYIFSMLGLPPVTDITLASRKSMLDIRARKWSPELLDAVGATEQQLGKIVESGQVIGELRRFGRVDLGIPVPVVAGSHDSDCGLLGVGVYEEAQPAIAEITGTYDHLGYLADGHQNLAGANTGVPFLSYCGPLPDTTVCLASFSTSGALLEWFMREVVGSTGKEAYDAMWKYAVFDGRNPVRVDPRFSDVSGAFLGLGLGTTKTQMFSAIIEALTFEGRRIMEVCKQYKRGGLDTIRIGGGPSQSDEWMQLRADVFGIRFERMQSREVSSVGAAVIAAASIGLFKDIAQAERQMVRVRDCFEPDKRKQECYQGIFERYISGNI